MSAFAPNIERLLSESVVAQSLCSMDTTSRVSNDSDSSEYSDVEETTLDSAVAKIKRWAFTESIGKYDLNTIKKYTPCFWINQVSLSTAGSLPDILSSLPLTSRDLDEAEQRWQRLRPVLSNLFSLPDGVIESPLHRASTKLQTTLGLTSSSSVLLIKEDSKLAVCGSVKARGGLYETFKYAEDVNLDWSLDDDSSSSSSKDSSSSSLLDAIQEGLMEDYTVVVGSTGNLGLSVGLAAASMVRPLNFIFFPPSFLSFFLLVVVFCSCFGPLRHSSSLFILC